VRSPRASPRTLRIVVHGLNERAYSMLSLLFAGAEWADCSLVGSGQVDLAIVDLDTPSPERTWREFRNRHPDVPSIVLSLREQQRDNARHVRKPVDAATLRRAIDALRAEADAPPRMRPAKSTPSATPRAAAPVAAPPPPAPAFTPFAARVPDTAPHASTRDATAMLEREVEERNCGTAADVDLADRKQRAQVTYDPARHFQGVLEQALAATREWGVAHEVSGLPAPLRILPGRTMSVATTLKDTVLRSLCVMTLQPGSMRVTRTPPGDASDAVAGPAATSAEALLWQVALWTARGRLRAGIEPTTLLRLRHWPDFTRIAETPHAMRIAAVLVLGPHTAQALCTELRIAQRHVFSFLAAAATTSTLELWDPAATAPAPQVAPPARAAPPRSLLARILGRLVGAPAR